MRESTMQEKLHVENVWLGERNPTCHDGNPLHGGITVQKTIQILCNLSQRKMVEIPYQNLSTTWIYAI